MENIGLILMGDLNAKHQRWDDWSVPNAAGKKACEIWWLLHDSMHFVTDPILSWRSNVFCPWPVCHRPTNQILSTRLQSLIGPLLDNGGAKSFLTIPSKANHFISGLQKRRLAGFALTSTLFQSLHIYQQNIQYWHRLDSMEDHHNGSGLASYSKPYACTTLEKQTFYVI